MSESREVKPGDTVTVRAKVLQVGPADIGLAVELFSKTDQYSAWIRADLIAEHIPAPAIPAEPEPGAYLIDGVLCVCFATDNGSEWTAACPDGDSDTNVERFDWASLWERVGGPVTRGARIVRLLPVLSRPDLPWSVSPLRVVNAIHADLIVQHRLGHVLTTFGAQFAALSPDMADAMAAALLAAARAAREASC